MQAMTLDAGRPDFQDELEDLESAEDFLDYFGVDYDRHVVQVSRLHILQRFHDYLRYRADAGDAGYEHYRSCLARAYEDFVRSDAQTEKVFRVFKRAAGIATVPLTSIRRARR